MTAEIKKSREGQGYIICERESEKKMKKQKIREKREEIKGSIHPTGPEKKSLERMESKKPSTK